MSKRDELKGITNSIVGGFIAPQTQPKVNNIPKKEVNTPTKINVDDKQKAKFKNGVNLNNNYTITIKIDADLEDYLKNIDKITFIESVKNGKISSTTKTDFINDYIRDRFYKLINASDKDTPQDIKDKWDKYKQNNNL